MILVSSRPNLLLSTIRSRCQTIRFAPVSPIAIETYLRTTRSMSPEDAGLASRVANGSIAKAASVDLEQYRTQRESFLKIVERSLGAPDRPFLVRASEQLNDAKNKDRFEENLEILEALIRDLWLLKSEADLSQIRNSDIGDKLMAVAAATPRVKLAASLDEIEFLRQSLAVNINRKIATDALFMKMSA